MKRTEVKIIKEYKASEFGLPVIIKNVPVVTIDGHDVLDINHAVISELLFAALIVKPTPLTGAEVRFMRLFMGLTLESLAESLHITHPTILAWERHGDEFTKMTDSIETMLRIFFAKEGVRDSELVGVIINTFFDEPRKKPENIEKLATVVELATENQNNSPQVSFSDNEQDLLFLQEA
jgi:transcriptional regulator with XRE-family HTH domain